MMRSWITSYRGIYKGIGFDVIGLDPMDDADLPRHKKLFKDCEIVNIENLKDLELCGEGLFWFGLFSDEDRKQRWSAGQAVAWIE